MELSTCTWGGIEPLVLPWADNPVSVQGSGATYGIALTLSDPNQFFSVKPALNANNTFVVNQDQCKVSTNYSCIALNGGVYTPPDNVLVNVDPTAWNGTPGGDVVVGDNYQEKLYNDRLRIQDKEIPGFPFYTYERESDGATQPSSLAIGINSSFLQAALDLAIVGTKAWSLWPGNWYTGLDGLLILGGYDQDRVGSEFITYELGEKAEDGTPIPMYLEVTGLEWEFSAGNLTDLMPNDTTKLDVTLEPFRDYITLPYDSMALIVEAYNATYNYTAERYMFDDWPTGNLVVTLAGGEKTVVPAEDLFDWPVQYDSRGYLEYTPDYYYTPKLRSTSYYTGGYYLTFGQPFLTQKVIVADFENGKYHIADAVKQDLGSGARNLKPLCTGGATFSNGSTTPSPTPLPPKDKVNVAAIAGGVGGGVGGLLVIALIAFFVLRRRKQKKQAGSQQQVPYLPEVTQTQVEPPYRGQTMSPPPKYMTSGVYETGVSEQQQQQQQPQQPYRYQSPPPQQAYLSPGGSELASPRSENGTMSQWGGSGTDTVTGISADPRLSQVGGSDSKYEMSSENRFTATSGPFEMPHEYDPDDRVGQQNER